MHERLMSVALRETLDSVVSPDTRESILAAALAGSAEPSIPSDVTGFREFVRGPLRQALVERLGASLADTLVVDLERLGCSIPPTLRPSAPSPQNRRNSPMGQPGVAPMRSARSLTPHPNGKRPASAPPRRSLSPWPRRPTPPPAPRSSALPPPPSVEASNRGAEFHAFDPLAALPDLHAHLADNSYPAPPFSGPADVRAQSPFDSAEFPAVGDAPAVRQADGPPTVVLATRDRSLLRTLVEWLEDRARVVNVNNVLDLVQHAAESRSLIVLDCNRPAVRPVAVAALAEELPPQTRVVLWGPSVDDENAVRALSSTTERWIRCDSAAPASLAKRCVELVS